MVSNCSQGCPKIFLDLGKNLGTPGGPPWSPPAPPWSPRPPIQGATFENPFRRPCLLIVTDFKTIPRGASDVSDCGKNLGTHGAPPGSPQPHPLQGGTFENSLRRPCLLIVACWVSILLRFQQGKRIQGWHNIILNGTPTGLTPRGYPGLPWGAPVSGLHWSWWN